MRSTAAIARKRAAKEAATQQAMLRSASERRLGEVTASLDQAKQQLKAAEGARVPRRSLAAARAAIAEAEASLQKAGTSIQESNYQREPGTAGGICQETSVGDGRNRHGHEGARQVRRQIYHNQRPFEHQLRPARQIQPVIEPLDALAAAGRDHFDVSRRAAVRRGGHRRAARAGAGRLRRRRRRAPRSGCARDWALRPWRTTRSCGRGTSDDVRWPGPSLWSRDSSSGSSSSTHCGLPTDNATACTFSPAASISMDRMSCGIPIAARNVRASPSCPCSSSTFWPAGVSIVTS